MLTKEQSEAEAVISMAKELEYWKKAFMVMRDMAIFGLPTGNLSKNSYVENYRSRIRRADVEMSFFKVPDVDYPTLIDGYINGPIRCESLDGSELWLPAGFYGFIEKGDEKSFLVSETKKYSELRNFKPFTWQGKTYCVSHLQKKATYFSLLFSPFIYHWGKFWHLQEYVANPDGVIHWLPGTEQGLYFRTPGWRWQVPDANSNNRPWILSGGRILGTHLD